MTVHDIVRLDIESMNHKYRPQVLDKLSGVILRGDKERSMDASLFKWLEMRRIYLINMIFYFDEDIVIPTSIHNIYVDIQIFSTCCHGRSHQR